MGKNFFVYVVIIACLYFAAFSSFYNDSFLRLSLYVVLPFSFLLCFFENGSSIKTNQYVHLLWGLFAWIAFTALYAAKTDYALREMNQILGVILISYVFGVTAKKKDMIPWLYIVYIVLYMSVWNYARNNILGDITFGEDRLDDDKLNANMMAYYTFYVTFALFMLGEIVKKEWIAKLFRVLFILTIPLSFLVAIYTASRQVFVIQIPLVAVLMYRRYFISSIRTYKVVFILAVIALSIYAIPRAQSIYENSLLRYRNEQTTLEDGTRTKLMIDSFKVGMNHFFTGVGAGNYSAYSFDGHFSHNTYLELFANNGIIGIVLFIVLMAKFIKTQYRRYKATKDKMYFYFFWFGIMFALDCMFYVFYPKIWLMGFFLLVASHSEHYFNSNNRNNSFVRS